MTKNKNGFLNLNKPAGWTSHDCVAALRRILQTKKVGHGGTLDPAAVGVLPIAVGKATRLLQFLPQQKTYRATIRFGVKTTTDDLEGEIIETNPASELSLERIEPLLAQFIGQIEQIPPVYSAIQQGGKRLYQLARAGEEVKVPVRKVEIDRIEVLAWHPGKFPEIEIEIACGSGTYIRSIARDLGEKLNIGGTLAKLIRTASGGMNLSQSLTLEQIETQIDRGVPVLIPPATALQHLPAITLAGDDPKRWCQGQKIAAPGKTDRPINVPIRVHDEDGELLGIGELNRSDVNLVLEHKVVI
jgi:tRNA pseudouridine55 synthase